MPDFPRRLTQGDYPLSYAQEGLWFSDQWQPVDPINYRLAALRLSSPLDVRALERSVSEVVRWHEGVRVVFPAVDGQPTQMLTEPQPISLSQVNISELAPARNGMHSPSLSYLSQQSAVTPWQDY